MSVGPEQVKLEDFGNCTNIGECVAACPKEIQMEVITRTNRGFVRRTGTRESEIDRLFSPGSRGWFLAALEQRASTVRKE